MFMANEKSLVTIDKTLDELETFNLSGSCIHQYIVRLVEFFCQSVPSNR
jgi:hypothetical protein